MNGTTLGYSFIDNNENDIEMKTNTTSSMINTVKKYKPADILKKLKSQSSPPMRETFRSQITAFNEDDENQSNLPPNPISMGSERMSFNEKMPVTPPAIHPLINARETFANYDMGNTNREHFTTDPKHNDNPTNMFYDFGRHMSQVNNADITANDNLQEKINYIIHMLEQNKQMRTENIYEEMVMYFFLGFFVLYVSDNFVKMGKYTR